jgi:hypothetical protein
MKLMHQCDRLMLVAAVCGLLGSGCSSVNKPESARFASVEIHGNTPGQISQVALDVFRENGYQVWRVDSSKLVFEKEGSTLNNVAYGSWLGGSGVWIRVKASIVPVSEQTFRLQCQAYLVRDRGGATEDEIKVNRMRGHRYQKLLDEVARRLAGQGEPAKP